MTSWLDRIAAVPAGTAAAEDAVVRATDGLMLVAIPAFAPAIIVVGIVVYIARKDRREERLENELLERALGSDAGDDEPGHDSGSRD